MTRIGIALFAWARAGIALGAWALAGAAFAGEPGVRFPPLLGAAAGVAPPPTRPPAIFAAPEPPVLDPGSAALSAARQAEARRLARERRLNEAHEAKP